ncbi:DNA internalization-related competence protein ComEC/Rec2 [Evansella sp. AB-rgal1]|uniref:DNA internalization-related competence protein ComEC/Rec2 n=1 Tax=Evansella sp. AB-rgal1 TaxID=3242696 RepID=UPI00359DB399
MTQRLYCYAFLCISGILFAVLGFTFWSFVLLFVGCFPFVISIKKWRDTANILIALLCVFLFYFYTDWHLEKSATSFLGSETTFRGVISNEPSITNSMQFSYEINVIDREEKLQVFSKVASMVPTYGQLCWFEGKLQKASSNRNPYGFSYDGYLKEMGIHWILSTNEVTCNDQIEKSFKGLMSEIREKGIRTLNTSIEHNEARSLMIALIYGDRSFITEERITTYQKLGALHLLAVSGLHVGMITFSLFFLLCRVGLTRETAAVILICLFPFYIFLTGAAPSVIRASLMSMLILLGTIVMKRKWNGVDVIACICILLLFNNPLIVFHLGFQLSFLTSFALLVSTSFFHEKNKMLLMVKVTLVAQLFSLPLTLYHFYEVSLFTLPINVLFIPFISLWFLPLSFITMIFFLIFPPLGKISLALASYSLHIAHEIIDFVVQWKWGMLVFGQPSNMMVFLMYIIIIVLFLAFERKSKLRIVTVFLLFLLLAIQMFSPYFRNYAVITMLDVGQGDSIVVELPRRKGVYLIDTGGIVSWDGKKQETVIGPGKRVIEPFLKGNGIYTIDKLILTHGHMDHVGEVCTVVDEFIIKKAYYPIASEFDDETRKSLQCIFDQKIPIQWAKEGQRWREGRDRFAIIHPNNDAWEGNNRSIVLVALIEGVSFLFTGDLEEEGERRILADYPTLSSDILKVGHHGSKTSSSEPFLTLLQPKIALVSAGQNNRYNHPHNEVLDLLDDLGIVTYRTDYDGGIQIFTSDGKMRIVTTLQRE